ncbi:MAG: metallophosphoesterase [Halobacteriota archaeon]
MESEPFIVVSDVHLGCDESNVRAFSNFCDWLKELERDNKQRPIIGEPTGRTLQAPKTLILLGDILELWAPETQAAPLQKSFAVFDKLLALSCDKVYVLGNHDEGLSDYCFTAKTEGADGSPSCVQQEFGCESSSHFLIVNGHYPNYREVDPHDRRYAKERERVAREEVVHVDERQYIFLHGHQFDKMFRSVGPLRRVPGIIKGIADKENDAHKGTGPVLLGAFAVLAFFGLTNWMNTLAIIGQPLLWSFVAICGVLGISWAWATLQKPAWTFIFRRFAKRPKCSTIGKIIDEQYYDCNLDKTSDRSIIVFGHTHVPGSKIVQKQDMPHYGKKCSAKSRTKTFVNSGAWITPKGPRKDSTVPSNTFVYIDREGPPLVLRWNDDDEDNPYAQYFKLPEESTAC